MSTIGGDDVRRARKAWSRNERKLVWLDDNWIEATLAESHDYPEPTKIIFHRESRRFAKVSTVLYGNLEVEEMEWCWIGEAHQTLLMFGVDVPLEMLDALDERPLLSVAGDGCGIAPEILSNEEVSRAPSEDGLFEDDRVLIWQGLRVSLTTQQSILCRMLLDAHKRKTHDVSEEAIVEAAECSRVANLLRSTTTGADGKRGKNALASVVIKGERKGTWRLRPNRPEPTQ